MPASPSFDYAIVRVVPRVEREEFVNVGVVLFCPDHDFLAARGARLDVGLDRLQPEDRLQQAGADAPDQRRPAEQVLQGARLGAERAGERQRREVIGARDVDAQARSVQRHAAGEFLAHHFEADHQVRDHGLAGRGLLLLADARAGAPGQELRIPRDVTDQFEYLVRLEGQDFLFAVDLHSATAPAFAPNFACVSRAARNRAKSSPA